MKTITVITPSNIEVEYRLAGAGSRLASFLIDFFVQMVLISAAGLIVLWWFDQVIFDNTGSPSGEALGIFMVFAFAVQFGYFIVCEMALNGQSVGKRIFGLRVIRENGQPLEFWQSVVRGLLRSSLDMLYVGLFVMLFSKKHKRVGDMAAGTIVVSEHYENESSLFNTPAEWQSFLPDPFLLTPEERQLAEDWLNRRHELPNNGAELGEKLAAHFKKYQITESLSALEGDNINESFSN
ncbi:MAG: RDD family protein [Defluviitaleaceae bacterium]|nr:RDD family protein [Defluviitaleaceae bacterium]MCL2262012.1 RDD family protein [Defluviitaleaceae bacterium]